MEKSEILIIDDDEGIIDVLTILLEDVGYKVGQALNGRSGLEYLKSHKDTKLILLDLMMPVMNGYQFREHQQRDTSMASIPVIVLTAGTMDTERLEAMKVAAYVKKNFDIDTLLEIIRSHISNDVSAASA
jgi:CheY-like chemotaxis protein